LDDLAMGQLEKESFDLEVKKFTIERWASKRLAVVGLGVGLPPSVSSFSKAFKGRTKARIAYALPLLTRLEV
jgi:hypothetical protein